MNNITPLSGQLVNSLTKEIRENMILHWENLPLIKKVGYKVEKILFKSKIRTYLHQAFSIGIIDDILKIKRHVLSVNELFAILVEKNQIERSKSSVYYHLEKLIDSGHISEVLIVKEQNILTSYYSKSSKLIFFDQNLPDIQSTISSNSDLFDLLKDMNPKSSDSQIASLLTDIDKKQRPTEPEFYVWLNANESFFRDREIDFLKLFSLFNRVTRSSRGIDREYTQLESLLRMNPQ